MPDKICVRCSRRYEHDEKCMPNICQDCSKLLRQADEPSDLDLREKQGCTKGFCAS